MDIWSRASSAGETAKREDSEEKEQKGQEEGREGRRLRQIFERKADQEQGRGEAKVDDGPSTMSLEELFL